MLYVSEDEDCVFTLTTDSSESIPILSSRLRTPLNGNLQLDQDLVRENVIGSLSNLKPLLEYKLGLKQKGSKLAEQSRKNAVGVDSASAQMIGSVGLEVMSSSNPDLRWKTVKKGRRSRKSGARSLTDASKAVNFVSPKRVGDFSGSDSDKFGEGFAGRLISGKSESVPIKKRRHLLCQDSVTQHLAAPVFEDRGQHHSHPSDHEYNAPGDFSGIELLAAAASMDGDSCNGDEDLVAEGSSLNQKCSDASDAAAPREICFKSNTSENFSNMTVQGGYTGCSLLASDSADSFQSLCENTDGTIPKVVNRQHWDLNTPMDAWDELGDPVTRLKGLNDDIHLEKRPAESSDYQVLNLGSDRSAEPPNLGLEENNSVIALADETCIDLRCIESPNSYYSNATACGVHNAETENYSDERVPYQALCSNSRRETPYMVMNANAIQHGPPSSKPCSILVSEEKIGRSTSDAVDNSQIDDCSSYLSESERTRTSDKLQSIIPRVLVHGMATCDVSQSAIELHCEDTESLKTSELAGTTNQDGQIALIADSRNQNDGLVGFSVSRSMDAELVVHEDDNLPMEELKGITVEDSSKSSSAGVHDDQTNLDGKVDSANNAQHDSDVSQGHHIHMADGDDLTDLQLQEGYDSPSEDGELRRSYLYSWEENDLDNEYVDYESDGRKGDDADMAEHPGSELIEGGSEVSRCTERRNLAQKRCPEGTGGKCGPIKPSQTRHFVKYVSANNEMAGKGSNAGSGTTTVEQSTEMNKENDTTGRKRQLTDRGDALDAKMPEVDQYASEVAREKRQSRIEGRSSMDTADVNDSFFTQPFRPARSRRLSGPYSRPERDASPNGYMARYRPTHGERDGAQWTSSPSRRHHTSNYEVAEVRSRNRPRNVSNDSAERIGGLDYHVSRQTANYMPKGLHRSGVRGSFIENGDYVVRRRMHPTRGASSFRGRGHYLHRAERDFDDLAPLVDDIGAPSHFPRSFSRRERSFSPSSGRSAHMHIPRRRSRSRSRSQSPRAWHPRERTLGRRHPKSPYYGSETRGETLRVPFQKPAFAPKYGDGYTSPSGRRFSPQRNYRLVEDPTFTENHFRRRRSPVRVFRHPRRFDTVSSSGQLK